MCFFSAGTMAGEILLDTTQLTFNKNEKTKQVINIRNVNQDTPVYVEILVNEVLEPEKGTKSELKRHESPMSVGLFVAPGKMVIQKGVASQSLSIININNTLDKERVYRVDVRPVISGIEQTESMAVKVLMAYDIVIHVQPDAPFISSSYSFDGNSLILSNDGNARFFATNGKACKSEYECYDLDSGFIYSGKKGRLQVAYDVKFVSYDLVMSGQKTQSIIFTR
jgi:P pilus assembly chaperone PapD